MGWRFQKRIKILPGVSFNLGKRGASVSAGPRGAKVTLRADGTRRSTIGLPGTGLSATSIETPRRTTLDRATPAHTPNARRGAVYLAVIVALVVVAAFKFLG